MADLSRRSFMCGAAAAAAGTATATNILTKLTPRRTPLADSVVLDTAAVSVGDKKVTVGIPHDKAGRVVTEVLKTLQRPYQFTFVACDTTGSVRETTTVEAETVDGLRSKGGQTTVASAPVPLGSEKKDGSHPVRYLCLLQHDDGALYVGESDAYVTENNLTQYQPETEVAGIQSEGFRRENRHGYYRLRHTWNQTGALSMDVGKTRYETAARTDSRTTPDTYNRAVENPLLQRLGERLYRMATDEVSAAKIVPAFGQGLIYYHDRTTDGAMAYPKYAEETLVDGGGDCEDKATLMAGMFEQEPFNYDTVLLFPPDHAAIGVAAEDLPDDSIDGPLRFDVGGTEYVYVESTGNVPIGESGSSYEGEPVAAYDGSNWKRLRPTGVAEFMVDSARQFITGKYD